MIQAAAADTGREYTQSSTRMIAYRESIYNIHALLAIHTQYIRIMFGDVRCQQLEKRMDELFTLSNKK